jgi:hypothetical protein
MYIYIAMDKIDSINAFLFLRSGVDKHLKFIDLSNNNIHTIHILTDISFENLR